MGPVEQLLVGAWCVINTYVGEYTAVPGVYLVDFDGLHSVFQHMLPGMHCMSRTRLTDSLPPTDNTCV